MTRRYDEEIDALKVQMNELERLVKQALYAQPNAGLRGEQGAASKLQASAFTEEEQLGSIHYSGQVSAGNGSFRWEPQERRVGRLLEVDSDRAAKVLSALGHKQRLDILKTVLQQPLTGAELVERLNMGTTGQLYHHIKALLGADLLVQEERGGKYSLSGHRALPLLLLLASASDLIDTTNYMELEEARNHAGDYFGGPSEQYDPHMLLEAVVENTIMEHRAGYCSEVHLFLHRDGSLTVADNGRGIPVQALPHSNNPGVQAVLTEINRYIERAEIKVPGAEKGISIPIVNALSQKLSVEIRRDGSIYRQDYKHGIPQSGLLTVGATKETGTSVTFLPDRDIFRRSIELGTIEQYARQVEEAYPSLAVHVQHEVGNKQ
ncbi:ATP-binding protein [Paenibacillus sp. YIM B09110]|uniref:ATP-binding protein n=1 Tax=Paenibacillus sp. YIM B09110 TaxID=3126102 RepID=UPI00301DC31F